MIQRGWFVADSAMWMIGARLYSQMNDAYYCESCGEFEDILMAVGSARDTDQLTLVDSFTPTP
jgi:hypothetical protein